MNVSRSEALLVTQSEQHQHIQIIEQYYCRAMLR